MSNFLIQNPVISCRREDIPARLHFKNNPNTPEILILADRGWQILDRRGETETETWKGAHGYDNAYEEMETVLIANGKEFKPGVVLDKIESVHVYPLLAFLLGFEPLPNNGSLEVFRDALQNPPPKKDSTVGPVEPSTTQSSWGKENKDNVSTASCVIILVVNLFVLFLYES